MATAPATASGALVTCKYTNPDIVAALEAPKFTLVCWPADSDEEEEEDDDDDADRDDGADGDAHMKHIEEAQSDDGNDEWEDADIIGPETTDKGFSITKDGKERFMYIIKEVDKRDQDRYGVHIMNDWSGYGMTEVLENMIIGFNKILRKKDVSPIKKWAYVEGIVTFLTIGDLFPLMMNKNGQGVEEVFNMFVVMLVTSYEILGEAQLLRPDSPISNVPIISILLLDFFIHGASDFDIKSCPEIVRAADRAGILLEPPTEAKIAITAEEIEDLRDEYKEEDYDAEVDWDIEFSNFVPNHPGGSRYSIAKMGKRQKSKYQY